MCGIAGVAGDVGPQEREAVRLMCAAMHHRGPDDEGFFDGPGVSLGMRRLSIIDVNHGQQPTRDESGAIVSVFNGEIYNFRELQSTLRSRGHKLSSESDSECLPHLFEDSGAAMVDDLRGMFAVAVWDSSKRQLFLARDRAGKKPLFYRIDGPRIWFASELKCLLAIPGAPRELDPEAVDLYLTYQYVPHPWSIVAGVKKLPPAHRLTWRDGVVDLQRYWQLDYAPMGTKSSVSTAALGEQLREQLLEATKIRMVSERPLGAFLSGGLDSSAVVAAMARSSTSRVSTFSIGFKEEAYNELPHARRVAELYGTDHHELVVEPDIETIMPRIARMFDEPFADSSAIPSYYVAEMARRDVVVVLNGDGGDESLGGYTRYANYLQFGGGRHIPRPLAQAGTSLGQIIDRRGFKNRQLARLGRGLTRLAVPDPVTRYAQMMSYFYPPETRALYSPEFAKLLPESSPYDLVADAWDSAGDTDVTNRLLACDVALYLPGDLLPKVDITTMSVSLEARSPFLDHKFMEWSANLPGDAKVRGGTTKWLMKQALEPWLPKDLIHRKKMGFGIPREEWLRGSLKPLVQELLLAPDARTAEYLDQTRIRELVDHNQEHGNLGARVWALLMLELWHREVQEA